MSNIFDLSLMCGRECRQLLGVTSLLPPYRDRISLSPVSTSHLSGGILGQHLCASLIGFWGQNPDHQACTVNSVRAFPSWVALTAPKFSFEWLRKLLCIPIRERLGVLVILHIKACGRSNCAWLCMSCYEWVGVVSHGASTAQSVKSSWIQGYGLFFFQYLSIFFKTYQTKENFF